MSLRPRVQADVTYTASGSRAKSSARASGIPDEGDSGEAGGDRHRDEGRRPDPDDEQEPLASLGTDGIGGPREDQHEDEAEHECGDRHREPERRTAQHRERIEGAVPALVADRAPDRGLRPELWLAVVVPVEDVASYDSAVDELNLARRRRYVAVDLARNIDPSAEHGYVAGHPPVDAGTPVNHEDVLDDAPLLDHGRTGDHQERVVGVLVGACRRGEEQEGGEQPEAERDHRLQPALHG
jgi:hypothetical protein